MVDRGLVAAAAGLAGTTVFGAYVSVRENIAGEPLGQRLRYRGERSMNRHARV